MSAPGHITERSKDFSQTIGKDEKIAHIRNIITKLSNDSTFEIVPGTLSFAASERQSIGVELPYDAMEKSGLTVKCTRFGEAVGMIKFFEYLATNSDITSFMPCEVGGGCLKGVDTAIAECLRKNQTLEALDVHYCKIGEEGVLNIVNALEQNTSLKYLNIRANGISDRILNRLLEILKNSNRTLMRFSFTQENYPEERGLDKQLIQQADAQLRANTGLLRNR